MAYTGVNIGRRGIQPIAFGDTPSVDAFSRARVSDPVTLLDVGFEYDAQPLVMATKTVSTGATVTHSTVNGMVTVKSSTKYTGQVPLGTVSAVYRYSWLDYLSTMVGFAGVSVPIFWLAILMIIVFSVQLGWLPSSGMVTVGVPFSVGDLLRHLVMPAVVLATFPLAQLTRYVRASMVDVLAQDYVRTARAKGLPELSTLGRHALKNALIPMVTVLGVLTPRLLGGAVITETIFAWPGLGRLAVDAAVTRDYPIIMGVTLLVSAMVIVCNPSPLFRVGHPGFFT